MIKLFSLKQKAEEDAKSAADGKPKTAPGLIRMQKGAPRAPPPPPSPPVGPPPLRGRRRRSAARRSAAARRAPHAAPRRPPTRHLGALAGVDDELDFFNGKEDLMNFRVSFKIIEGIYKGGSFVFKIEVPKSYPHDAPKVLCETTVFHPNIDMEGHVCLNILREDWKPVLTMQSILMGLHFILLEPNPDDPLNKEAAKMMVDNRAHFQQTVTRTFRGGTYPMPDGKTYSFPKQC